MKTAYKLLMFIVIYLKLLTVKADGSLTFLIDNSGSMHGIINEVKKGTEGLMHSVTNSSATKQFILISFDGYHSRKLWVNSRDPGIVKTELNKIENEYGSTDEQPPLLYAIDESPPYSDIYVFTDESWNYLSTYSKLIMDMCQMKQTKVHFVLSNRCFMDDYQDCGEYKYIKDGCNGTIKQIKSSMEITEVLQNVSKKIEEETEAKAPVTNITEGTHVHVPYNGTLYLTCTVSAYPAAEVTWSDAQGSVSFQSNQIKKSCAAEPNYNYTSMISKRGITSAGEYVCAAKNTKGVHQSTTTFTVLSPFNVYITPEETTNTSYSKEATIQCKINSSSLMRIEWFRKLNSSIVQLKTSDEYTISSDRTELKIKTVTWDSVGQYTCKAALLYDLNQHIEFSTDVIITKTPPVLDKNITQMYVTKGTNTTLDCKVIDGKPYPKIQWFFKQKSEDAFEKIGVSNSTRVNNIQPNASGIYKCAATNEIGTDEHFVDLVVEYAPMIQMDDTEIKADIDDYITLTCHVDANPLPNVTWFKDGRNIRPSKKIRFDKDHSIQLKVRAQDRGTYQCRAENKIGVATKNVTVDVYAPPVIERIVDSTVLLSLGSSINISCRLLEGNPQPRRQWYFKQENEHEFIRIGVSSETLEIRDTNTDVSGTYRCTANNRLGFDLYDVDINVGDPPQFLNNVDVSTEKVGDELLMKCNATGIPEPTVTWYKNGEVVSCKSKEDLIIRSLSVEDEGNYTCVATNRHGSANKTLSLVVYDAARIVRHPRQVDDSMGMTNPNLTYRTDEVTLEAVLGDAELTLPCKAEGKPKPIVTWSKDGVNITSGSNLYTNPDDGTLVIKNIDVLSSGKYVCAAFNDVGRDTQSYKVLVRTEPEENTPISTILIELGESVPVKCEVPHDESDRLLWYKDGRFIEFGELTINNTNLGDTGMYVCSVGNARNGYIEIIVGYKPRFTSDEEDNFDFQAGDLAQFNCEADGIPTPMVRWWHNGKIQPEDSMIYTFETRDSDEGIFECEVSNEFGYITRVFKLRRETKPEMKQTGRNCLPGNNEIVEIVYKEMNIEHKVYEVCLDKDKNLPIYVMHDMDSRLANVDIKVQNWTKTDLLPIDFQTIYDCEQQMKTISAKLNRKFYKEDDRCFVKRQLISPRDVHPGLAQQATFNDLVVVPQWSLYSTQNWEELERRVRWLAKSVPHKLLVWTGTAKQLRLQMDFGNGATRKISFADQFNKAQAVPLYLWKVIQDPVSEASLAIIQLNQPDLLAVNVSDNLLCRDICPGTRWMHGPNWHDIAKGFTYCCNLEDFESAFDFSGLFRNYKKILV